MNCERKRVLLVGGFPDNCNVYGGQVTIGLKLLRSSFMQKYDVRIIDSTQLSNPPPIIFIRALFAIRRLAKFLGEIFFIKPDCALIFVARGASVFEKGVMVRLAKVFGISVLVFPRAGGIISDYFDSRTHATLLRYSLTRADALLCQGRTMQRFAVRELGFSIERAPVIPNWSAEAEHLEVGRRRFESSYSNGRLNILFLGWMEQKKGIFELLNATKALVNEGIEFKLFLAGDGSARGEAEAFVKKFHLSNHVVFLGWLDAKAKIEYLATCDIFVLPSWDEGFPNAMVEALSAGLACVVSNVGMISDFVKSGEHAILVPSKDVVALQMAIWALFKSPEMRRSISKNGHEMAQREFGLESGVNKLVQAVDDVCDVSK